MWVISELAPVIQEQHNLSRPAVMSSFVLKYELTQVNQPGRPSLSPIHEKKL